MGGSEIATIITSIITGVFSVLVIAVPLVAGRRAAVQAKESETHLPHLPSDDDEIIELVHRNRREIHMRLDSIETLIRSRACPFSDDAVAMKSKSLQG